MLSRVRRSGWYGNSGSLPPKGTGRRAKNIAECREAMGIDWMVRREIVEAVPPAYTEHVGLFLLRHLDAVVV